jgi:hypothetical protein
MCATASDTTLNSKPASGGGSGVVRVSDISPTIIANKGAVPSTGMRLTEVLKCTKLDETCYVVASAASLVAEILTLRPPATVTKVFFFVPVVQWKRDVSTGSLIFEKTRPL